MVIANLKNICRGRCLHRPVVVCPIYNPWKNAMTLGQRAHNVHPYGLYGETRASICFERILFTRSRSNPYFYSYILLY